MEPLITNMESEVETNNQTQEGISMFFVTIEKEFFKEYEHSILDMNVMRRSTPDGKSDTELLISLDSKHENVFINIEASKHDNMYRIEQGWQNPHEPKSNYFHADQYPDADRLVTMLQIKLENHVLLPAQKPESERGTLFYDAEAAHEAIAFLKAYLDAE